MAFSIGDCFAETARGGVKSATNGAVGGAAVGLAMAVMYKDIALGVQLGSAVGLAGFAYYYKALTDWKGSELSSATSN